MSRFFAATYEYDSATSSFEEDLLSSSSEEELLSSSGEEESDDSFFAGESEEESESESELESDFSDGKPYGPDWFKKAEFRKGAPSGGSSANKFLKTSHYVSSSEEESDDEGKKVVKSARDKLLDEMREVYDKIETAEMTDDWITIQNEVDSINRMLTRSLQQNFGIPNIFIKVVAQVEDMVGSQPQAELTKKDVSRAFNSTKQRIRKIAKEHQELLNKFRENPESFDKEPPSGATVPTAVVDGSTPQLEINQRYAANKAVNLSSLATATSEASFVTALRIVIDSRGKKNVDSDELIKILQEALPSAKSDYEKIMAYLTLIPIRLDTASTFSYQPIDQWKDSCDDINKLLALLEDNIDKYQVLETAPANDDIEKEPEPDADGVRRILGSVFSFVERLDDEWTKSLLNIDPHSSDYLARLKDEQQIYNLILRTQLYLETVLPKDGDRDRYLTRAFIKRLDHIYYKPERLNILIEKKAWEFVTPHTKATDIPKQDDIDGAYIAKLVNSLTERLSKSKFAQVRTRATLYYVYFTALNGDFQNAKDSLISSNIQTNISKSDSSLQILFNRVVVQLGLSAFQACLITECHQVLNELLASAQIKEILGQQPLQRVSSTIDNREQQCVPYHQHINLDLIDVVFMTCSLLIEIPQMAAVSSGIWVERLLHSQKSIRRLLEHYDRASFQAPPSLSREYVMFAAKAVQKGDWKTAVEHLRAIKSWALLPDHEHVLNELVEKIKIVSLKSYFFTYRRFYDKFFMKELAEVYELPVERVAGILDAVVTEYGIECKFSDDKSVLVVEPVDKVTMLEEVAVRLNREYKSIKERLFPQRRR